jgi:hypothetical protein
MTSGGLSLCHNRNVEAAQKGQRVDKRFLRYPLNQREGSGCGSASHFDAHPKDCEEAQTIGDIVNAVWDDVNPESKRLM